MVGEDDAEGRGKRVDGIRKAYCIGSRRNAHGDTDEGGDHYAYEDGALYLEQLQDYGKRKADEEKPESRHVKGGKRGNAAVEIDYFHIKKADVCHENTYAAAYGVLETVGDSLYYVFSQLCDRDDYVDDTADKHHGQRLLPGEPKTKADRVYKECVKTHSGCLRIRYVCDKAHYESADYRSDDRRKEYGAPLHACAGENVRVDCDDIGHRKESGKTGYDLSRDGRPILL